jgi:hypothetical protein
MRMGWSPVTLAPTVSLAEIRRAKAVGLPACELGVDRVPGVVVADLERFNPRLDPGPANPWMPASTAVLRVWGGVPTAVALAVRDRAPVGLLLALQVYPATRWARARAWWRVVTWPVVRWLERRAGP